MRMRTVTQVALLVTILLHLGRGNIHDVRSIDVDVDAVDEDGDGVPDAWEQYVADFFSPHIYFHPDETYFPVAVETFVNHSTLLYAGSLYSGMCVMEDKGFFTADTLPALQEADTPLPWELCGDDYHPPRVLPARFNFGKRAGTLSIPAAAASTPGRGTRMLRGEGGSSRSGSQHDVSRGSRDSSGSGSGSDAHVTENEHAEEEELDMCGAHSLTCFELVYAGDGDSAGGKEDIRTQCIDSDFQEYVFAEHNDVASDSFKGFSLELGETVVNRHFSTPVTNVRELDYVPVYAHVFPPPLSHPKYAPDTLVIQYWMLYPCSGKAEDTFSAGQHEGDWEHVSLIVSNSTLAIHAAYFAAHSHESMWLAAPDYEVHDGHVRLFVARNTHASYPTIGRKPRMGGMVYDECSSEGLMWAPRVIINVGERERPMQNTRWLRYNGFWGSVRATYNTGRLPFPTGSPPRTPPAQKDYWTLH
jgi:hypothetical protein